MVFFSGSPVVSLPGIGSILHQLWVDLAEPLVLAVLQQQVAHADLHRLVADHRGQVHLVQALHRLLLDLLLLHLLLFHLGATQTLLSKLHLRLQ